jgi:hypothetical protein
MTVNYIILVTSILLCMNLVKKNITIQGWGELALVLPIISFFILTSLPESHGEV